LDDRTVSTSLSVAIVEGKSPTDIQPTVLFDGLKEDSVSSSWGREEWEKFLA
jgi:hypothetical protein